MGQYLEQQAEECQEEAVKCQCEKEMDYQFKRQAKILSVFGWTAIGASIMFVVTVMLGRHHWIDGWGSCRTGHSRVGGTAGVGGGRVAFRRSNVLAGTLPLVSGE